MRVIGELNFYQRIGGTVRYLPTPIFSPPFAKDLVKPLSKTSSGQTPEE
jgi:hypothetical protein